MSDQLSACCNAELLGSDEDPLCSECKEHCDIWEADPSADDGNYSRTDEVFEGND